MNGKSKSWQKRDLSIILHRGRIIKSLIAPVPDILVIISIHHLKIGFCWQTQEARAVIDRQIEPMIGRQTVKILFPVQRLIMYMSVLVTSPHSVQWLRCKAGLSRT